MTLSLSDTRATLDAIAKALDALSEAPTDAVVPTTTGSAFISGSYVTHPAPLGAAIAALEAADEAMFDALISMEVGGRTP